MRETLGTRIRAGRLGFHPLEGVGYVRCEDFGVGTTVRVIVRQAGSLPSRRSRNDKTTYRVWWRGRPQLHAELARRIKAAGLDGGNGELVVE